MDFKSIILLLMSIGWLFLCQRWYCCWMQEACLACSDEPRNAYPIGFIENNSTPDTTYRFEDLIAKVEADRKPDHFLEISGRYISGEQKELGFKRAENTFELLQSSFSQDSIFLRSQKAITNDFSKEVYSPMVDIQWVPYTKMEVPEKLIVRFLNKTTNINLSAEQTLAVDKIRKYALANNAKISVTGHSDATGLESVNEKYSLLRAQRMAEKLSQLGISSDRMVIESFGSKRPIDNEQPSNNRRTEITILN